MEESEKDDGDVVVEARVRLTGTNARHDCLSSHKKTNNTAKVVAFNIAAIPLPMHNEVDSFGILPFIDCSPRCQVHEAKSLFRV
jgi:hypothetical protein